MVDKTHINDTQGNTYLEQVPSYPGISIRYYGTRYPLLSRHQNYPPRPPQHCSTVLSDASPVASLLLVDGGLQVYWL